MTDPTFTRRLIAGDPEGKWSESWLYEDPAVQEAALVWALYGVNLADLDNRLNEPGWDSTAAQENRARLIDWRARALAAWREGDHAEARELLGKLNAWLAFAKREKALLAPARIGVKFMKGRKVGTVGPVRAAVRRLLKRAPTANAAEIWDALVARPPKGMTLFNAPRLGKYIETAGKPDTGYGRFANIVSEEKKRSK